MSSKDISRRDFLKTMGVGAVTTAALAAGCKSPNDTPIEGAALGEVPTDKMTYREGSHGEKVSLLGYGCMRWPTIEGESGRENEEDLDQDKINELVDYAIAHGVNLFDTAPPYCKGRSEHATGIALSRHDRSEYLLSTKCSNFRADKWSRQATIEMYHNSMKELQTDYLDFYMLHSIGGKGKDLDGNELSPMDTLKARFFDNGILDFLVEERAAGRIKNLGFSYHGDIAVFDYMLSLHDKYHWDHVLIQHNYVDWHHAKQMSESNTNSEYLYSELEKRNIPAFVMEPLLGGQLGKINEHATAELKQHEPQMSVASWAFRFSGNQPRILTVLSGMTYMEHLQDNIRTYSPHKPLNEQELEMLERIAKEIASFNLVPCTGCKYCMPCPYGLDIPSVFSHFNKCLNEGTLITDDAQTEFVDGNLKGKDLKEYRRNRRAYLVGYDRSVPKLRQANHCIACNRCLTHCPQGINIPEQMQRIDQYTEQIRQGIYPQPTNKE